MHVKDKMTIFGVGEESPVLLGDAIIYFQASILNNNEGNLTRLRGVRAEL